MNRAGDVVEGIVTEITPVGVFAESSGQRYVIPKNELSWSAVENIDDVVAVGESITFYVVSAANRSGPWLASRRRALTKPNKWQPKPAHLFRLLEPIVDQIRRKNYSDVLENLRNESAEFVFYALFQLATNCGLSKEAWTAAKLLLELNVACPQNCVDVVRDITMAPWNVSLEQLPFYVARRFGLETTLDAIRLVRQESLTPEQWTTLDTIEYWVRIQESRKK